jgi:copper chaperone CopZ
LHAIPGRVRFRDLPEIKRNPACAETARAALAEIPGVSKVEANPTTGSILVEFDSAEVKAATLIGALRKLHFASVEGRLSIDNGPKSARVPRPGAKKIFGIEITLERAMKLAFDIAAGALLQEAYIPVKLAIAYMMDRPVREISAGRIRFSIPALRTHADQADALEQAIRARPGIEAATVDAVTGSITVKFAPGAITADELLAEMNAQGLVDGKGRVNGRERSNLSQALQRTAIGFAKQAIFTASKDVLEDSLGESLVKAISFVI